MMEELIETGQPLAIAGILILLILREVFSFLRKGKDDIPVLKNGSSKEKTVMEHIKRSTDENNQRLREMEINNHNTEKTMDRVANNAEEQTKMLTRLVILFETHFNKGGI